MSYVDVAWPMFPLWGTRCRVCDTKWRRAFLKKRVVYHLISCNFTCPKCLKKKEIKNETMDGK